MSGNLPSMLRSTIVYSGGRSVGATTLLVHVESIVRSMITDAVLESVSMREGGVDDSSNAGERSWKGLGTCTHRP